MKNELSEIMLILLEKKRTSNKDLQSTVYFESRTLAHATHQSDIGVS